MRPASTPPRASGSRIGIRDLGLAAFISVAYMALLVATAPRIGMSRDEGIYVLATNSYAGWFQSFAEHPSRALERESIDRFWSNNHEHPGLVKSLFALSKLANDRLGLADHPTQPYRFPAIVLSGLLIGLTYMFGARTVGRQSGAFAAAALALMPQFFHHAHLACFDVPIAFFLTLTVYYYHRSLASPWFAIPAGLSYGLALATKHNAWILPGVLLVHFLWMAIAELSRRRRVGRASVSLVPYSLLAMTLIGPLVFVATWPWLYHDTVARFREYAGFHLNHEYYNMAFYGLNYYRPPFPIAYPFVMTAFTVPFVTLALAGFALVARFGAFAPWPAEHFLDRERIGLRDLHRTDVLFVGCLFAPIVVIALPSTPIFGGTKHWLAAYPFLALYAGWAARRVVRRTRGLSRFLVAGYPRLVRASIAGILLLPSIVETAHSLPFGLGHYTFFAGFTPGAADKGMNRQFWGYTTAQLGDFFREHAPDGARVYICDTVGESFEMMKRDGALPTNLQAVWTFGAADYAIVHHEHHFAEVDGQLWVAFSPRPVFVLAHDGVPFVSVYENPVHAARRRATSR